MTARRALAARLAVPALDLGPVDDVPPGLEVRRTLVLVLEVVGVLPDVDAEQRHVALHEGRVLVRRRVDREAGAVPGEPRPAAAEALDAAVVDRSLERVERPERIVDRGSELAPRCATAVRRHDRPEQGMVRVP